MLLVVDKVLGRRLATAATTTAPVACVVQAPQTVDVIIEVRMTVGSLELGATEAATATFAAVATPGRIDVETTVG